MKVVMWYSRCRLTWYPTITTLLNPVTHIVQVKFWGWGVRWIWDGVWGWKSCHNVPRRALPVPTLLLKDVSFGHNAQHYIQTTLWGQINNSRKSIVLKGEKKSAAKLRFWRSKLPKQSQEKRRAVTSNFDDVKTKWQTSVMFLISRQPGSASIRFIYKTRYMFKRTQSLSNASPSQMSS